MTFNEVELKNLITMEKIERPISSSVENKLITNEYMNGALYTGSKREPLYITVRFFYTGQNTNAMRRMLSRILITEELKELSFSDEPDIFYYAKVDGDIWYEERRKTGKGTITFLVPEGVGYSRKHIRKNYNDKGLITATLENNGTDYAYPVFDFMLNSHTYMIALSTATATYQFGQALEDAPKKTLTYKWEPFENWVEVTKSITTDNYMTTAIPGRYDYFDISTIRPEWFSLGGRYIVTKETPIGPSNGKIVISYHAKQWQTGEKIADGLKGKTFTVADTKVVNQSRSSKAYLLKDSSKTLGWLLEQDINNQLQMKGGIEAVYPPKQSNKWYGSSISRPVQGNPTNWQLDVRSGFQLKKHSEYGMQYVAVLSGTDVLFSFEITAHKQNRTVNTYLVANGRGITFNQDSGRMFFQDFEGLLTFNFMDGRLTVEARNTMTNSMISQSWNLSDMEGKPATSVVLFNARYEDFPVPEKNYWNYVKFTGFDSTIWVDPADEFYVNGSDPQFVFSPGDQITLDMNDNKAYVNGLPMLTPVARASESIKIPPGIHDVIVTSAEMGEKPTLEINYRERWK